MYGTQEVELIKLFRGSKSCVGHCHPPPRGVRQILKYYPKLEAKRWQPWVLFPWLVHVGSITFDVTTCTACTVPCINSCSLAICWCQAGAECWLAGALLPWLFHLSSNPRPWTSFWRSILGEWQRPSQTEVTRWKSVGLGLVNWST